MSEVEQSFNNQRLKILKFMDQKGIKTTDILFAYDNIPDPKYKFTLVDISNVLNGKRKYTPSVKWLITFINNYWDISKEA